mgnify:CR=1 FL=1
MALNPKLNVYVVTLNPKEKDTNPTYRDLFKAKYMVDEALLALERIVGDIIAG